MRRATSARTTRRPRTTTCIVQGVEGDARRPRLLRVLLLRAERRQAEPGRRSTAATAASSRRRDDPGRQYTPLSPAAVHVPVGQGAAAKPQVKAFMDFVARATSRDRRDRADRPDDGGAATAEGERPALEAGVGATQAWKLASATARRPAPRPWASRGVAGARRPSRSLFARGADLGPDHDRDRRLAAARDVRLLRASVAGRATSCSAPTWSPLFQPASVRRPAARRRHARSAPAIALVVAIPLGLGSAIYLSRVRERRASARPSSRCSSCWRASRRSSSASSRSSSSRPLLKDLSGSSVQRLQRPGGRRHHGLHGPADHRLAVRGRDVGGAAVAARGRLRARRHGCRSSLRVVFPAALSGIVAAIVLGVSRAVGETMIVLIAGRPACRT